MKRYIFDIDKTLLDMDFSMVDDLFRGDISKKELEKFSKYKHTILDSYESKYVKYEINTLVDHFKKYNISLTRDLIEKWIYTNGNIFEDKLIEGAIEVLEYLKEKDKELVILSNWFSACQIARLKRAGIYDYFDEIICGDTAIKPSICSYAYAAGDNKYSECIMIGDNKVKDYYKPLRIGMKAYLVSEENPLIKVKTLE